VHIAYQVVGNHQLDLILVPGWVSHVEHHWEEPRLAYFLRRLASFSRLIVIDKRGTGLSDRTAGLPDLEQRMDDMRAVMDAVGSKRAVVFGYSEGGSMCQLFAATYPERTAALITYGCWAKRLRTLDYPWAPSMEDRLQFYDFIVEKWGGVVDVQTLAPSVAHDPEFCEWFATYLRRSASPGAALAIAQMNTHIDTRHILPTIRVPTLVIHRTGDMDAKVEEGRYLAEHIPGSTFLELPGNDHLPWVYDASTVLDAIEHFLVGLNLTKVVTRKLVTVLSARGIESGNATMNAAWRQTLSRFRGEAMQSAQGKIATFDGSSRAIHCASALRAAALQAGVSLRIGLHAGECQCEGELWMGEPIGAAEEISGVARPGEILVTRAVKSLIAGSGIHFTDQRFVPHVAEGASAETYAVDDEEPSAGQRPAFGHTAMALTKKQKTILQLVAQGLSNKEIADVLSLSEHTVHRHVANIFDRLNVSNRAAAVAQGLRRN
jgi:pimeloyl-ACP methyl ester carboxylesterase/DNA-binding CsgD family transcriptional regulator